MCQTALMRLRFKVERQNKPLDPWKIVFERECTMSAAFIVFWVYLGNLGGKIGKSHPKQSQTLGRKIH